MAKKFFEEEDEGVPLWERQPWDTDASYAAFRECYLPQPLPRTYNAAYMKWCERQNRTPYFHKKTGRFTADSRFLEWASAAKRGKDPHPAGTIYEHAVDWKTRAHAWDAEQDRLAEKVLADRRRKLVEDEYRVGEKLRQRGMTMLSTPPTDFREADITGHVDLAFKLLRRALNMEQGRMSVDWKSNLKQAGIDPEQAFEDLVDGILNQHITASGTATDAGGGDGGSDTPST